MGEGPSHGDHASAPRAGAGVDPPPAEGSAQTPAADLDAGVPLAEALGVTYTLHLRTGAFDRFGPGAQELLGGSPERLRVVDAWASLVHPLDRARVEAAIASLELPPGVQTGLRPSVRTVDLEHRLVRLDGRAVAVRNLARRVGDRLEGLLLRADVPEPAAAPGLVSRELLARAVDVVPIPMFVEDEAGGLLLVVNRALCDLLRAPREALLEAPPEGLRALLGRRAASAAGVHDDEAPFTLEARLAPGSGESRRLRAEKAPLRDGAGRRYLVGTVREAAVGEEHGDDAGEGDLGGREFLARLLDSVADPIFVKDERHRWVVFNRAFEELMGHPREELLGRSDYDFFPREEADVFWAQDEVAFRAGEVNENEENLTDARGRRHVILTKKQAFTQPDGRRVLVGVIRDVTERRAAEQALRESEERFRAIFNQGPLGMAVLDLGLRLRSVNDMLCRMLAAEEEDLIGRGLHELTHPEDRSAGDDTAEHLLSGALTARKTERRCLRRDGGVLWASLTLSVICDHEGEPLHFLAMVEDVGERKRAEATLLRARDAALQSAQVKARFLANVSHEIRTPLNAVIGMTGLLLDGRLDPEQRECAELIRSSGDALLTLLNDILDFSKLESDRIELERRPLDVRDCVEESLDLLATRAAEKGLELVHMVDPTVPATLLGDSARLRQVLINLLSNAVKFTARGLVQLDVVSRPLDADTHEVRFTVADTGPGIPADRLDRLFQSFSQVDASTTRQYGGTGLGLVISRRLVELMGGRMWVESAVDRGSAFHFTVVALETTPAAASGREPPDPALSGRRLLVVDDVPAVRLFVVRQAAAWGVDVDEAADVEEALEHLRAGAPYDAVLVDRDLPAAELVEAARAAHGERCPPVVLLTPFGRVGSERHRAMFQAQVTKPIKPAQLRATLDRLLAGAPRGPDDAPRLDDALGRRLPLHLLVVDDNAVNLRVAVRLLERLGYRADVAASGHEALAALQRQPYDVVLLDVQMPELDGLEVARRVRARDPGPRPRIVALTADVLHGDRERCLAAGMDDFVGKPVRLEELRTALERAAVALGRPGPGAPLVPAAPRPGEGAALDEEAIAALRVLSDDGDDRPVADLYALLLRDALARAAELRAAAERGDRAAVLRISHGLRGGSANVGARLIRDAAAEVEAAAGDGDLARLAGPIAQLERAVERTRVAAARRFQGGLA
ncbi:MAG: PAS domain S-box protein [Planctomycetes bacterium]|nr:PAS domain S-box protein [Planctomycetota bacterium]